MSYREFHNGKKRKSIVKFLCYITRNGWWCQFNTEFWRSSRFYIQIQIYQRGKIIYVRAVTHARSESWKYHGEFKSSYYISVEEEGGPSSEKESLSNILPKKALSKANRQQS